MQMCKRNANKVPPYAMIDHLFDKSVEYVSTTVPDGAELHAHIYNIMLQCFAHLVGSNDGKCMKFRLCDVSHETVSRVQHAMLKMGIYLQVQDDDVCFQDPRGMFQSELSKHITYIQAYKKKLRFVHVHTRTDACGVPVDI